MKMDMDALQALELKLAEYTKANGAIAEHMSANVNSCSSGCMGSCDGNCKYDCAGSCKHSGKK